MKSVGQLASPSLIGREPNYQAPTKQEIPSQVARFVDRLFTRLKAIFPAWKSAFVTENDYNEAKLIWLEALVNNGITTAEQFKQGIAQAEKSATPFFPSVGQFIEWCKLVDYSVLGLPDEVTLLARVKAFQGYGMDNIDKFKFVSNAEYWLITTLYCRCKTSEWSDKQLVEGVSKELAKMVNRIKQGELIPAPQITLPKVVEQRLSPQEIANRWSALRDALGAKLGMNNEF